MTKSELIVSLANSYPQLLAKDAELTVKTILDAMADALAEGQRIEIRGFGSFALSVRPPQGRTQSTLGRKSDGRRKTGTPTSNPARNCVKESTQRQKRTDFACFD